MRHSVIWAPEIVVANDHEITWLRDPDLYPYLREVFGFFPGRNGKPNLRYLENDGRHVVGYESSRNRGLDRRDRCDRFRRFWQWHPSKDPYWPPPEEAVRPCDIVPGIRTAQPMWRQLIRDRVGEARK